MGFFTTLGLDISFLEENVEKWDQLDSYLAVEAAVKNRKVVNDSSERGVKITYHFLEQARKEDRFQQSNIFTKSLRTIGN